MASSGSIHNFANTIICHAALREDAFLIDLARARKWSDEDAYDGLHFTDTGSRQAAEVISREMARHIAANSPPVDK